MKEFLKDLFEYNHHYNQKLAQLFIDSGDKLPAKSLNWLNHICNAHHVWNSRILQQASTIKPWDAHPISELPELDRGNFDNSILILETVDLENEVTYVNFQGQAFSNKAKHILFHAVNHSTYHRGQIAADLRQNGLDPLVSDYIFYKRS
jgi:uncharacterized damage-inducible protein DinB